MKEDQPDTHDERAWRFCRTQHNRRRDWTRFGIVLNSLRRLSHRQIAPLTTVAQRLPGWGQSLPRFRSELAIMFKVSLYVNEVFLFSLSHWPFRTLACLGQESLRFWLVLGPFLVRITEGDLRLFLFTKNRRREAKSQRRRPVAFSGIDLGRGPA